MKYRQIQPPDALRNYIKYFWALESDAVDTIPKTYRPVPDGCPGLIFQQSEKGILYDRVKNQLPVLFLYGQTIQHREMYATGNFSAIGICFYPHALKSVFGLNADEFTDSCIDLDLMANKQGSHLSGQLLNATSVANQVDLLSSYLLLRIRQNNTATDPSVQYALAQIIQSEGTISLKTLLQKINMSERSLERKFKQYVGISPKLFARVCRFQTSLNQLRNNRYHKLSDIAFDNGYADQSHLIRAFKEFAGFSPNQYRKQYDELVENLPEWIQ